MHWNEYLPSFGRGGGFVVADIWRSGRGVLYWLVFGDGDCGW